MADARIATIVDSIVSGMKQAMAAELAPIDKRLTALEGSAAAGAKTGTSATSPAPPSKTRPLPPAAVAWLARYPTRESVPAGKMQIYDTLVGHRRGRWVDAASMDTLAFGLLLGMVFMGAGGIGVNVMGHGDSLGLLLFRVLYTLVAVCLTYVGFTSAIHSREHADRDLRIMAAAGMSEQALDELNLSQ